MFQHRRFALAILTCTLLGPIGEGRADGPQTVGLFLNAPGSFDGYTLIAPGVYPATYLINNEGLVCHSWSHTSQVAAAYLLENGDLLRGGRGATAPAVDRWDWDGNLVWSYFYTDDPPVYPHHDIELLPNGNVVILAWETKTEEEAIAAGRDPATLHPLTGELWPEHLVEIQPVGADSGVIVWEWHVWDHLIQDFDATKANFGVVADHPELMDVNYQAAVNPNNLADWTHANAVTYNAELDQLVISHNFLSEFWIIDHSTTTEEAAGHTGGLRGMGGDILYRWGNPEAYDRGTPDDRRLYTQHHAQWIPDGHVGAGNILLFNNGTSRPSGELYSTIMEIQTTVDPSGNYPVPLPGEPHGPPEAAWEYVATPPGSLYARSGSGCQRLPNGNTLMIEAPSGRIREIDASEQEVWKYVVPIDMNGPVVQGTVLEDRENVTFRTWRYAPDYPGFDGRDLTPGAPIELPKTVSVHLSGFTAEPQDRAVLVSWFTSYEYMHDGFNVYRSRRLTSGYEKLNDRLIRGRNPYSYLDRDVQPSATYYYKLGDIGVNGEEVLHDPTMVTTPAWGLRTTLSFARPSPFSTETTLTFTLAAPAEAKVALYDVAGRLVRVLAHEELAEGDHSVRWDGRDDAGLRVAGGPYFVKLTAGHVTQTRKVVYLGTR